MQPELVATSRVQHSGGPCRHCLTRMGWGDAMFKLTRCCEVHTPTAQGTRNGKGVWVCRACWQMFDALNTFKVDHPLKEEDAVIPPLSPAEELRIARGAPEEVLSELFHSTVDMANNPTPSMLADEQKWADRRAGR